MKHQDYTVAVCNINEYLSTTNIGHRQHTNINVNLLLLVSYKTSIAKIFCHMYWGIGDLKLKAVAKKIWFTIFAGGLHFWIIITDLVEIDYI